MSLLKRCLVAVGLLPSRYLWLNPFKIMEYEAMLRGIDVKATDVVLDVGCGSGPQDFLLAQRARQVIGIDPSPSQIERGTQLAKTWAAGRGLELRCTTIERAGFARHQFDKVFSFSVFEHIVNRDEVLDTIAEVLRPGGELIMSCDSMATLTDPGLRERHRTMHAVLTYFTPEEIGALLASRGFGSIRIRPLFKSPYSVRVFEAALERGLLFNRYWKFGALVRMRIEEMRHRHERQGLFLLIHAVKLA